MQRVFDAVQVREFHKFPNQSIDSFIDIGRCLLDPRVFPRRIRIGISQTQQGVERSIEGFRSEERSIITWSLITYGYCPVVRRRLECNPSVGKCHLEVLVVGPAKACRPATADTCNGTVAAILSNAIDILHSAEAALLTSPLLD